MASDSIPASPSPISPFTRWLILFLASIGFAFDIYEILMLPLIIRSVVGELGLMGLTRDTWLILMLFVPAVFGGIFGLLGGYLTDRLGRRRVLTWSILLYAFSAFFAGYSTSMLMLLILRITTFIGVCVEFVAAVAWLAELFPQPEQREKALGFTQAFSSFGGLLVAVGAGICGYYGRYFPAIVMPEFLQGMLGTINEPHAAWRYTLMSGVIPALPLILIRPFLPESPIWAQKKAAGTLKRASFKELFQPKLRRTTIVTMIMFACSYGAAFGALQHIPRIVPVLDHTKEKVKEAQEVAIAKYEKKNAELIAQADKESKAKIAKEMAIIRTKTQKSVEFVMGTEYTKMQELGGLTGRFLLVFVILVFISRRAVLRTFQLPGLFILPLVFYYFLTMPNIILLEIPLESVFLGTIPISTLSLGVFLCGLFTVAQFSFWGNYLPTVYPVHLRGTGESFAANIGGRLLGTSFWALTVYLSGVLPGESGPERLSYACAAVAAFVFVLGLVMSFFLPEPEPESLED